MGFEIYAEIGVYHPEYLISGLVDILFVKGDEFFILDWKTNKAPIRFEGGYWTKKADGTIDLDIRNAFLPAFKGNPLPRGPRTSMVSPSASSENSFVPSPAMRYTSLSSPFSLSMPHRLMGRGRSLAPSWE